MILAALITQGLLIAGLIGLLHHTHRQEIRTIHGLLEQQDTERQQTLTILSDVIAGTPDPHPDVAQLVALVDRVCQRIQAPTQAVVEHTMAQPLPEMPQPITPDVSDQEFWERMNQSLPKEALAEQMVAEELNGN